MPVLTQSVTVPAGSTGGAFGTITHVGTDKFSPFSGGTQNSSIAFTSLSPGDLIVAVLGGGDGSAAALATAVGSGGSTGWVQLVASNAVFQSPGFGGGVGLWMGQVVTAGADTLNATFAAAHSSTTYINCMQFTTGQGAGTIWTPDHTGSQQNASSTTIAWPSLTPTGTGELYIGGSVFANTHNGGATAGYTYKDDTVGNVDLYNPAISAVTAPTATQNSASTSGTVGALIRGQAGSATTNTASLALTAGPPTGRMWVISQIGFEILPASVLTTVLASVTLNGRSLYGNQNANGGFIQGPPYISVRSGDNLVVNFTGAPIGASMVVNFFYNEYSANAQPSDIGGLV